jgi:hypothetical protein
MRPTFASFASLTLLGLATAAHASTFSLPTGSTATVAGKTYTITGSVTVSGSDEITAGSFTIDGLPTLGNTTFSYTSDSTQGSGTNAFDVANFNTITDANSVQIYSGSLVLYTLPVLKNGDIVICDGPCTSGTDSATETSAINLSFAASPYSLQGTFGGALDPAPTPEPSSLILMGSGILAVAGAARRKLHKA